MIDVLAKGKKPTRILCSHVPDHRNAIRFSALGRLSRLLYRRIIYIYVLCMCRVDVLCPVSADKRKKLYIYI